MPSDRFTLRKSGRQSRALGTVDAILQASAQIVSRDGLGGLNTNRIAEVAGVSIGSLYQYFPGKDAVLHAVVERQFHRAVDDHVRCIDEIDPQTTTLEEAVARIVDQVFDSNARGRPLYRQFALAALSFRHLAFVIDNDRRVLEAARRKLSAYSERGAIGDPTELELVNHVALWALKGIQLGRVLSDRAANEPGLREIVVRLVLACVAAPGRRPGA